MIRVGDLVRFKDSCLSSIGLVMQVWEEDHPMNIIGDCEVHWQLLGQTISTVEYFADLEVISV